jgi:arabinose-5-phosphate isomerase
MTVQPRLRLLPSADAILRRGSEVIQVEAKALGLLASALEDSFVHACEEIFACAGRVVVTGMGKSGHIGRKWAATLAATGTPAIYVHPAEAAHGDLGMLVAGDVLVVLSNSGNTPELRAFLRYAGTINVPVIGVASRADSFLLQTAAIKILLPQMLEACPANIAPTTSTTLQLALGDAIAMTLMDMRGFSRESLKTLHPGGSLGLRLMAVGEIMHGTSQMPLVEEFAAMREVIVTMTSRGFGIAGVVDAAGRLIGVITDGDLRRHFNELTTTNARDVMTSDPKTLTSDTFAEEALHFLNENKITCAFVMNRNSPVNHDVPVGIIHLHDFLRVGMG